MTKPFAKNTLFFSIMLLLFSSVLASINAQENVQKNVASLINDTISMQIQEVSNDTLAMRNILSKIRRNRRKLDDYYMLLLEQYALQCSNMNYNYGLMKVYDYIGLQQRYNENYEVAADYHQKSMDIAILLNDSSQLCYNYNNLGQVYRKQDLNSIAIPYFHKALEMQEKLEQEKSSSFTHNTLGATYLAQNEFEKALYHLDQSIKIAEKRDDKRTIAFNYGLIGEIHLLKNQPDSALSNFSKAILLKDELNFTKGKAVTYHLMAEAWYQKNNYKKAFEFFNLAIPIHEKYNSKRYLSLCYAYIGKMHLNLNQLQLAKTNLDKALEMAEQVHSLEQLITINEAYTQLYKKEENWKQTYLSSTRTNALRDSLNAAKYQKQMQTLAIGYQTQKKEQKIEMLSAENEIKNQRLRLGIAIIVILLLVLAFAYYIIRMRKKAAHLKEEKLRQQLLKSQMNPHFIFNALGSIQNFMYKNDAKNAARYMGNFAALTRSILNNSSSDQVPLDEEIETLQNYLELEQMRVSNAFSYRINYADDLDVEFIQIPPMLLQPFIENSIKHGIKNMENNAEISVSFSEKDDFICAIITDNGIGINTPSAASDGKEHKSMATSIFKQRMSLLKSNYPNLPEPIIKDLKEDNKQGTMVQVYLPIIN